MTHRQGGLDAGRPVRRRDGRARAPRRGARHRPRRACWPRPSASSTARRSRPTRCSSARAPASVLLTTEGHRDVLEMREGLKDDRYNLRQPPPEPLVPRDRRLGVRERMRADGRVEMPLDEAALAERDRRGSTPPRSRRSRSATCTPGATAATSGSPPRRCGRRCPAPTSRCPREVLPQIKEYERVCTTVVNAYVGPALARYLERLEARLQEAGYQRPVLIMQSHGGVATIADAVRLAAGAVLSGPGRRGRRQPPRRAADRPAGPDPVRHGRHQHRHLAGGRAAQAQIASDRRLAGQRVALQALDIVSLGAGGGSIARVDAGARAARRPGERRRRARARLLRPRRPRGHGDRRQPRARAARPR